jgi:hypothetical protein
VPSAQKTIVFDIDSSVGQQMHSDVFCDATHSVKAGAFRTTLSQLHASLLPMPGFTGCIGVVHQWAETILDRITSFALASGQG